MKITIAEYIKSIIAKSMQDKRYLLRVAVVTALVLGTMFYIGIWSMVRPVSKGESILVVVPQGSTAASIGQQLEAKDLIRSADAFAWAVRLRGWGNKLKAGTYELAPSMSTTAILGKIVRGDVANTSIRITIPEGLTLAGVGLVFEERGLFTQQDFLAAAKTVDLPYEYLKAVPSNTHYRIEGYLFPDTYEFSHDATPEQAIRVMAARFNSLVPARYEQSALKDKYSFHQLITMASIVEKEAVKQEERARIAGVFYGRMRLGMQLESCATIQYIIGKARKLYLVDLEIESPYNTYRNMGLPPGPIANSGLASINAALTPENTDYLFFFAKSDGGHIFNKTYEQHLKTIHDQAGK